MSELHPSVDGWTAAVEIARRLAAAARETRQPMAHRLSLLASWLREARIYALSEDGFRSISGRIQELLATRWLADNPTSGLDLESTVRDMWHTASETKTPFDTMRQMETYARQSQMPEAIPFRAVFIALQAGVRLNTLQRWLRWSDQSYYTDIASATLLGWLVLDTGEVWHLGWLQRASMPGEAVAIAGVSRHGDRSGGFLENSAFDGAIIPTILNGLTQRVFDVSELRQPRLARHVRQARRRLGFKGKRPVPPPFYEIEIRPEVLARPCAQGESTGASWTLDHRIDVPGHWRVRVERGRGEISPETAKSLARRAYTVYRHPSEVDFATRRLLARRGIDLPLGREWLAVKKSWISPHTRGPESGPVVPAVRVMKGGA